MQQARRLKKVALGAPMSGEFDVRKKKKSQRYPENCPTGIHYIQLRFTVSRENPTQYKQVVGYLDDHNLHTESRLGDHNQSRAEMYVWAYPTHGR